MTRYARFSVDFTDGENMTDTHFTDDGYPATIEITDLWVIVRTDITETWTPRERIGAVSVGIDSAVPEDKPTCGAVYRSELDAPCTLNTGHDGQHVDGSGDSWG